jgi:hypothetical protein
LSALGAERLAAANINPATGLATDYLNHFNEAIMLLEMLSACPESIEDFLAWQPMSYREHFTASRFKERQLAIDAYDRADPNIRHCLDTLADTMTAVLEATRATMRVDLHPAEAAKLAEQSAARLKPLVARAGAVINGETIAGEERTKAPQATVDLLMKR